MDDAAPDRPARPGLHSADDRARLGKQRHSSSNASIALERMLSHEHAQPKPPLRLL